MEELLDTIPEVAGYISLGLGIIISVRSLYGYFVGGNYTGMDRFLANIFIILLYFQTIVELFIFLTSSFRYEESLKATEHLALIAFATIMTQGGRLISIKSNDNSVKFRFRSIYYGIATGLLIYAYLLNA